MPIIVTFMTPGWAGSLGRAAHHQPQGSAVYGRARRRETIAVGSATTGAARDGEIAIVTNMEEGAVLVALGTSPNATAATETAATTAGVAVAPGQMAPFALREGDRIGTAAA